MEVAHSTLDPLAPEKWRQSFTRNQAQSPTKTGFGVDQLAMVGDRLYTDIALGKTGITTVLVLSGETKREDLKDSAFSPDYIMDHIGELHQVYLSL